MVNFWGVNWKLNMSNDDDDDDDNVKHSGSILDCTYAQMWAREFAGSDHDQTSHIYIYTHHKSQGLHPVPQIKHLMLDFNKFNVQTFYYMDGLIMSFCKCMSSERKPLCKNWETHIDHNRPSYSNRSTERPTSRASLRNDQETPSWSLSSCLNSFMVVVPVLFLKHHLLSGIETPLQREKPSTTNKYWF